MSCYYVTDAKSITVNVNEWQVKIIVYGNLLTHNIL